MLEADGGTRRKANKVGHNCSFCKTPLYAPIMCELVWFPTVSSNAREFYSLEHLRAYNADCPEWRVCPERRRED
eukprot:5926114-Pleurochrysis_carterae.AAC.1